MIYTTFPPTSSNSLTPEGRQQPAASQPTSSKISSSRSFRWSGRRDSLNTRREKKQNQTNYHFSFNNPNVYAGDNNIQDLLIKYSSLSSDFWIKFVPIREIFVESPT